MAQGIRHPGSGRRGRVSRRVAVVIIAAAALATAACSTTQPATPTSALPPIMADVGSVDGTTVKVPFPGTLVITGDENTYASWEAKMTDDRVLTFVAGHDDGSTAFNPGFSAKMVGTTDVTMTNTSSGDVLHFTIDVTG